jgi:nucleoside phosphorylase
MGCSMRILIVHDRDEVGAELERIARVTAGVDVGIERAQDVFSALRLLRDHYFDLAVVDLTLPVLLGQADVSLSHAQLLLGEIFQGGEAKAPGDVLGISRDKEVLGLVRTDIGEQLMGCIHEDAGGIWRGSFELKLKYLLKARISRQLVANASFDFDVVLVTALDKEARPYADLFGLTDSDHFRRAKQFVFDDKGGKMRRGVVYAIGDSGQPPCASAVQALLTQFRPKLIMMTGFCGGVKRRVKIGDVVAFRTSAPWDYGKWEEKEVEGQKRSVFRARATAVAGSEGHVRDVVRDLINSGEWPGAPTNGSIDGLAASARPKLHMQGAGSGSAVVTSTATLDQITALDESIWAVDMESYAFYHACRNTPVRTPDFMCIKAVADHCNGSKSSKYHGACSALSARLAHHIVRSCYVF